MAYLSKPFEHDVFVSYAHGPARGTNGSSIGLSGSRTRSVTGSTDLVPEFRPLDIFIDGQLDPTQPLTDLVRRHVSRSGLLLVIMSNHYLNSAWCTDEREWFEAEVKRRHTSGGVVLVVRVQPTNPGEWPLASRMSAATSSSAFRSIPIPRDEPDELVHPYGWPEPCPRTEPTTKSSTSSRAS